ncbi:hypothetical protein LTSEADE_3051 [Salmonella enterica subsp. enterica serovar Adelaide str. A4-669]|uniref:Uncharacterized protein n=1 Tax=Salmonella enterica subsp. enterica serovar Adelaide str. A4-669 TaxID=913063 RepID=A0A6C8GKZ1_SALET|nr:hypothetical protein LTSEADE_3051 [Salmonella enterica subsp. enterica serovar Adelaide str. A4-669]
MISASALNSELINKIAQDNSELINKIYCNIKSHRILHKPPVWRLWLSIFMVMKYLSYSISRRFVS